MMMHLVMYDISDDRCRMKMAGYLEDRGQRIQESVFECRFTREELEHALEGMKNILGEHTGNVRIYPLCAECRAKALGIGEIQKSIGKEGFAVF